jgi:hypothetical protein
VCVNAENAKILEVPMIYAESSLTLERMIKAHDETGQTTRADLVRRSIAVDGGGHALLLQEQAQLQSSNA